jgi:hypothetical protein
MGFLLNPTATASVGIASNARIMNEGNSGILGVAEDVDTSVA